MPPIVLHRRRLGADLNRIGSRQFELSLCTLLKLAHLVGRFSLRENGFDRKDISRPLRHHLQDGRLSAANPSTNQSPATGPL